MEGKDASGGLFQKTTKKIQFFKAMEKSPKAAVLSEGLSWAEICQ